MPLAVSVTMQVTQAQLVSLGSSPTGPIRLYWLRIMADIDRTAKRKLSNQMVHVRTGNLRSSQQMPVVSLRGAELLGVAQNIAAYAYFVHEGTRAHEVRPRKGKFLTGWTYKGAPVFTRVSHIPAQPGRPWLRESVIEVLARSA